MNNYSKKSDRYMRQTWTWAMTQDITLKTRPLSHCYETES